MILGALRACLMRLSALIVWLDLLAVNIVRRVSRITRGDYLLLRYISW